MSASLVGSEMCIRDRIPRLARDCFRTACRQSASCSGVVAHGPKERRGCSVSYTHLTLPTICSV
eukprot:15315574-Alexandrium_andersonii.AAC.1